MIKKVFSVLLTVLIFVNIEYYSLCKGGNCKKCSGCNEALYQR